MFQMAKKPVFKKNREISGTGITAEKRCYEFSAGVDFTDRNIHYHTESPAPTVQMVRKRVKGQNSGFSAEDIYYDKADGRYYKGMTKEESRGNVTVSGAEYQEYSRLISAPDPDPDVLPKIRAKKTTILAKAEQDGATKYVGNIAEREEAAERGMAASDIIASADIYTAGEVITEPLKAVRLYAEGNMRHAVSLAKAFQQPGKYSLFAGLDAETTMGDADETTPEALIKATEFDDLDGLERRYGQLERENILPRIEQESLEASFGGRTGNMTRPVAAAADHPKRLYDIIQATFFWLPRNTNDTNFQYLKTFMKNQFVKLKPDGKIRIVLSDKNTTKVGRENFNHYRDVAEKLTSDEDLCAIYNINIKKFTKRIGREKIDSQTYSDKLNALGMNEEHFVHTRTDGGKQVRSGGDLLIEAILKPQ